MSKQLCVLSALTIWVCGALSPAAAAVDPSAADATADTSATSAAPTATQSQLQEITVTATRTEQSIVQVPISLTALTQASLTQFNVQDFTDYAKLIPNLTFSHAGFGALTDTTVTIRGIQGDRTTAFYIDDVPVPVNIDPRVLDIQRIEVLRGPQGTLFGESSMGGAVRLITNQPDTHNYDGNYMIQAGYITGAATPSAGGTVVLNIPLITDTLAVRFAGYIERDGGWLTRSYLNEPTNPANAGFPLDPLNFHYVGGKTTVGDEGAKLSGGGSISIRWDVTHNFTATARMLAQNMHQDGYPIEWGLIADKTTSFLSNPELFEVTHQYNYQSYLDDRWYMPSLNLNYSGHGWSLISSTSYFSRFTVATEPTAEGESQIEYLFFSPSSAYFSLPPQDHVWDDYSRHKQLAEEVRFNFDPIKLGFLQISGLVGYYWARIWTTDFLQEFSVNQAGMQNYANTYGLAASGQWPNDLDWLNLNWWNYNTDSSWFGALNFKLFDALTLSIGDRYYHLSQYNQGVQEAIGWSEGTNVAAPPAPNETLDVGHSPRYSLTYEINPDASTYASVARGFRAGAARSAAQNLPPYCNPDLIALGINPATAGTYSPDSIWDYEVGGKFRLLNPNMYLSAAVYEMDWTKIQQNFQLQCNYGVTTNAGEAKSEGAELEATINPLPPLSIHGSAGYTNAHITEAGPGQTVGQPLFLVPRWTAAGSFIYTTQNTFNLPLTKASGNVFYEMDYSYVGSSLSDTTNALYTVTLGQYHLLGARLGMHFSHSTLSLNLSNLTNGRDNFGDYLTPGWAFKTPTILLPRTPVPTFFVAQPRTYMLQYQADLFVK